MTSLGIKLGLVHTNVVKNTGLIDSKSIHLVSILPFGPSTIPGRKIIDMTNVNVENNISTLAELRDFTYLHCKGNKTHKLNNVIY